MAEMECVAGCKAFYGGERKHHRDCPFYPESLTKIWHDTEAAYLAEIDRLKMELEMRKSEMSCAVAILTPKVEQTITKRQTPSTIS